MKKPIIISIEGIIGCGKTTVINNLEKYFIEIGRNDIIFIREPVEKWEQFRDENDVNILTHFYNDICKNAFSFQIMALTTRYTEINHVIQDNPECSIIICERSLEIDKAVFANMMKDDNFIDTIQYQIYCNLHNEFIRNFYIKGTIFMDFPEVLCFENIKSRNRVGETQISLEYLQKCRKYHLNWFNICNLDLSINICSYENYLEKIISFINKIII
jgi:deoxyadenosine/deoxycytidine kinase